MQLRFIVDVRLQVSVFGIKFLKPDTRNRLS